MLVDVPISSATRVFKLSPNNGENGMLNTETIIPLTPEEENMLLNAWLLDNFDQMVANNDPLANIPLPPLSQLPNLCPSAKSVDQLQGTQP
jgi:hypothetical protein